MTVKIKPLGSNVVIQKEEAVEKTKSGIVLTDTAKEKATSGVVIAVGPGKMLDNGTRVPPEVKVGDKVHYSRYAGNEIKISDKMYLILAESEILAIL